MREKSFIIYPLKCPALPEEFFKKSHFQKKNYNFFLQILKKKRKKFDLKIIRFFSLCYPYVLKKCLSIHPAFRPAIALSSIRIL